MPGTGVRMPRSRLVRAIGQTPYTALKFLKAFSEVRRLLDRAVFGRSVEEPTKVRGVQSATTSLKSRQADRRRFQTDRLSLVRSSWMGRTVSPDGPCSVEFICST